MGKDLARCLNQSQQLSFIYDNIQMFKFTTFLLVDLFSEYCEYRCVIMCNNVTIEELYLLLARVAHGVAAQPALGHRLALDLSK